VTGIKLNMALER
jgi:hypothetical protein